MSVTPARAAFILQEFRNARAESTTIAAQYGKAARESDDPVMTGFDNVADAQAVANERLALFGVQRRRFQVSAVGLDEALALDLDAARLPIAQFVDEERGADIKTLAGEVGIDFSRQLCEFTIWG